MYSLPQVLFISALISIALFLLFIIVNEIRRSRMRYKNDVFRAIWEIEKIVLATVDFEEATRNIVNIILEQLGYVNYGYEVIVLSLLDYDKNLLRRIAISHTKTAKEFLEASPIPFHDIIIPLTETNNLLVQAVTDKKMHVTDNVADVLYPALSREWVEKFQDYLGIKTSIVYPILAKDKIIGTLNFSLSKDKSKISDVEWSILESFVGAVGIALDNSLLFKSLNETTQKLKEVNSQLQQLDKLKDEFVSLASHELRTPMTAIKSYLWMALAGKGGKLNEKQEYYLQRSYNSVDRLIKLVNDMLNISRIESGRITIFRTITDLRNLVHDVVEEVQPRADELGIKIVINAPIELPLVIADGDKLKEVIINLMGNSLKFTPKDGIISIDFKTEDSVVITSITDNGNGILAEDIPKLFQKFGLIEGSYATNQSAQGTGLGLYICKSIVEILGGKIWAHSDGRGKGATFAFSLPVAQKAEMEKYRNVTYDKDAPHIDLVHTQI